MTVARPLSARGADNHLYVIELGDDRIKVGRSTNPARRLAGHVFIARGHGLKPGRQWVSRRGVEFERETALINFCKAQSDSTGVGEYFVGVPFDAAVSYADRLAGEGGAEVVLAATTPASRPSRRPAPTPEPVTDVAADLAEQTWYTTREAAKFTRRHPVTVRKAAADGTLKSSQSGPGRGRRYRREWLEEWAARP